MKAAVLDGFTLNPGDLSWRVLQDITDITIYDKTAPDEVYERVKDCEAVLSNKIVFSKELIARLPKLRYIGELATGYNIIDVGGSCGRDHRNEYTQLQHRQRRTAGICIHLTVLLARKRTQ